MVSNPLSVRLRSVAQGQGLTLVHFSAEPEHFWWDALGSLGEKKAEAELASGRV